MDWGSSDVGHPHLNPGTVASIVAPKSSSPFITHKTATITVAVANVNIADSMAGGPNTNDGLDTEDVSASYDQSPCHDTAGSNSSTAALLRKTALEWRASSQGSSLHEIGVSCQDVHASSGSVHSSNGAGPGRAMLSKALQEVKKSLQDLSPVFSTESLAAAVHADPVAHKRQTYIRNLVVMSLSCSLAWSAFCALRNIQSSINHQSGLGLISMSSINVAFVIGCILAVSIVQKIRPKFAMLFTLLGTMVFIGANFYPSFYTLIPASGVLGISFAVHWTAQGTYLTSIGFMYATLGGKTADSILSLFNGFFCVMVQCSQIMGNLISSTVFAVAGDSTAAKDASAYDVYAENGTSNISLWLNETRQVDMESLCGIRYCHSYLIDHAAMNVTPHAVYILLSVLISITALAMVINAIWLDKLDIIFHRSKGGLGKQMAALFALHANRKQLLFMWITIYLGFEEAFIYGEITKWGSRQRDLGRNNRTGPGAYRVVPS